MQASAEYQQTLVFGIIDLCFQFLLEAIATYTKVSQQASIISWGPRFASLQVVSHSFILTSWPSFIIHLTLEPFPFLNHLATSG